MVHPYTYVCMDVYVYCMIRQLAIMIPFRPNVHPQEDQVAADEGPSRKRVRNHLSSIAASPNKLAKMDHTAGECILTHTVMLLCCAGCGICTISYVLVKLLSISARDLSWAEDNLYIL